MLVTGLTVREYRTADEADWLRCRVLAFLSTSYFDDVARSKPTYQSPSVELVALRDGALVGLIDVAVAGDAATIETIAVDPDESRSGVGSLLLEEATRLLPRTVRELDAWTREDTAANNWYLSRGFTERFSYLHVFAASGAEIERAVKSGRQGLLPVSGFFHANIEDEDQLRRRFRRVHVCRQYTKAL